MKDVHQAVQDLIGRLKQRTVLGSYSSAVETLQLIRTVVSQGKWTNVESLLELIRDTGSKLAAAQTTELAIGNVIRRLMHAIREEYAGLVHEHPEINEDLKPVEKTTVSAAMYQLLGDADAAGKVNYDLLNVHQLKSHFIQVIHELLDEVEGIYANISGQALDHIHSNEIIMTTGKSKTVEEFLKAAHRKRRFQVIVAEAAPLYAGHALALSLSKAGIETTLISDSAIYAVMSRVNKVILGTHAVLANGGLVAASGTNNLVSAAQHHHVPVVVCTGLYKLSPLQPFDEDICNLCVLPDPVMGFHTGIDESVDVVNPFFDYISPDYIDLFVTNVGGHTPSYIYRLLSENYDPQDHRMAGK